MSPQKIVRAQARLALKNQYVKAAAALAVLFLPVYVLTGADSVIYYTASTLIADEGTLEIVYNLLGLFVMLIGGILLSPVINGYIRLFYRNAVNGTMDMNDLFCFLSRGRYSRTLSLNISFMLRMLLPTALFFAPVLIYTAVCSSLDNNFRDSVFYGDFYFILFVLSLILTALYSLRYFLVFALYCEDVALTNRQLFDISKRIMSAHSGSAAKLVFSYTPWMLLCLTVLPALYVIPYMTQGLCIGAKWMSRTNYNYMDVPPEMREVMNDSITMHDRV